MGTVRSHESASFVLEGLVDEEHPRPSEAAPSSSCLRRMKAAPSFPTARAAQPVTRPVTFCREQKMISFRFRCQLDLVARASFRRAHHFSLGEKPLVSARVLLYRKQKKSSNEGGLSRSWVARRLIARVSRTPWSKSLRVLSVATPTCGVCVDRIACSGRFFLCESLPFWIRGPRTG